jgi:hypothetical protein
LGLGDDEFPEVPPPTATKPPTNFNFSVDPTDEFNIACYAEGVNNYANVAIHINER